MRGPLYFACFPASKGNLIGDIEIEITGVRAVTAPIAICKMI